MLPYYWSRRGACSPTTGVGGEHALLWGRRGDALLWSRSGASPLLLHGLGGSMLPYYWSRREACSPIIGVGGEHLSSYYGVGGEHAPLLLHGVGGEHAPLLLG